MDNLDEVKPANKFWRAVVFAVLFILPIGSLFYLYKGRTHSRTAKAELENLGQVDGFNLMNQQNQAITPSGLHGKVTIINFLPTDLSKAKLLSDRIAKVHQSFDETDDVIFLSFIIPDSTKTLLQTATELGIEDHQQWYLLGTSTDEWQRLSKNVYHLPNVENGVAMADTSLQIRKLYDINNNQQMGRMIEHVAKVVPKQKRR
ncbi:MAG: hypothetical protein IPN76_09205 [Saprospiraceae bacterium]|nr:hypothetical protein [Saprospiraceae bacterium]